MRINESLFSECLRNTLFYLYRPSYGRVCHEWRQLSLNVVRMRTLERMELVLQHGSLQRRQIVPLRGQKSRVRNAAIAVEESLWDFFGGNAPRQYFLKGRQLVVNLCRNGVLRKQVIEGSFSALDLVRVDPRSLATDDLQRKRKQWRINKMKSVQRDHKFTSAGLFTKTNCLFVCKECSSKQTKYLSLRRLDKFDRYKTIVVCVRCNHRWED